MNFDLDNRERTVLRTVIEDFIGTGKPIGSRSVSRNCGLSLSAASIRNVMAELEEKGFLEHTHTSSGRLPTDLGYRFYVDEFSTDFRVEKTEVKGFREVCSGVGEQLENMIRKVTIMLSSYSRHVGVVLVPRLSNMVFSRVAFIKLSRDKFLAVIVSKSGFVINNVVSDKWDIPQSGLDHMSNLVNDKVSGHCFSRYREILLQMMSEEKSEYQSLISKIMNIGDIAVSPSFDYKVFIEGQMQIISNPDFSDLPKIKKALASFEEKSKLINILDKCCNTKGIQIYIGSENEYSEMENYSLVMSKYSVNKQSEGVLGIIGPKRMEYSRVIPLVESAAKALDEVE